MNSHPLPLSRAIVAWLPVQGVWDNQVIIEHAAPTGPVRLQAVGALRNVMRRFDTLEVQKYPQ
jgi:hypothetical protein